MTRAKIMLGIVAASAIVGSVFAFKANNTKYVFITTTTDPAATICTLQSFGITSTVAGAVGSFTTRATTDPLKPCVNLTVKLTD
ncbi:hypothetical protein SAMN05518672_11561 [Chitinophaga sp. CF118]|uniref:hypothetical protein n=1 Tax=Chitinophaga sp. CF118 TaxID=1884367 RepID=UPI0008E7EBA8|nr:hypothetical protein [Chitinophaga sp. CF118]SFF07092.1 hypothetical protein SAMN05518672_11561 [Chitinophaga sp. CF118]